MLRKLRVVFLSFWPKRLWYWPKRLWYCRNGYGIGRNGYSVGRNGNHLTNWAETVILPFRPGPKPGKKCVSDNWIEHYATGQLSSVLTTQLPMT